MTRLPDGIDIEGPVQAEVFVVWLNDGHIELTGPDNTTPWLLEVAQHEHPVEVVDRIVRDTIGGARLVHSTSWRRAGGAIILTFVVVIDAANVGAMDSVPIGRADLARSGATAAPTGIAETQVLEHGLRHLAWLAQDDPVVIAELSPSWLTALTDYAPEPFRALG